MKHWLFASTSAALTSGEAELAGVIGGAGQGLGFRALLRNLNINAPQRVWTGSSAAIGICSRQGLGKCDIWTPLYYGSSKLSAPVAWTSGKFWGSRLRLTC